MCVCVRSCLTLCNPMECSLPGSSVHGIFQTRILSGNTSFPTTEGRMFTEKYVFEPHGSSYSGIFSSSTIALHGPWLAESTDVEELCIWSPYYKLQED